MTRLVWAAVSASTWWFGGATASAQLGVAGYELVEGSVSALGAGNHSGWAVAAGDLDGDGLDDLAVGAPDEADGGLVAIYLGGADGLQHFVNLSIDAEPGDRYGAALAIADFRGNGFRELAIGIPGKVVNGDDNAGEVMVVGFPTLKALQRVPAADRLVEVETSTRGLIVVTTTVFSQAPLAGAVEAGDLFGSSLATGDLSGDGIDDLAIGVPGEDVNTLLGVASDAGAVNIVYGSDGGGLDNDGNHLLNEETGNVVLNANADEQFGFSLSIGQYLGSQIADLAVGIPGELETGAIAAGAVMVFPGADGGLDPVLEEIVWRQNVDDVLGTAGDGDAFGFALADGDFDSDGYTDLAIGVPGETELGGNQTGAVQILYGGPIGLEAFGNQFFVESVIDPAFDPFDRFGEALASGDFDDDGWDDLAIGAPLDNSLGVANSGEVTVLYGGSPFGLSFADFQVFDMLFFGGLEIGDEFGFSLAAGRFDSSSAEHLAVGVPGREVAGFGAAGAAVLVRSQVLFKDGFEDGLVGVWSDVVPLD
ncbi:MAG: integrin alpha [Thermoanaerobaculia bacterium]|nr:integrin alpha [Thermoanaerobaculia bacterium]